MELPLHIYPAGASALDAALAQPGTKVLMKSGKAIGETAAALSRHGLAEDSAMVADCGLPTQQVFETMTRSAGEDQLFCHRWLCRTAKNKSSHAAFRGAARHKRKSSLCTAQREDFCVSPYLRSGLETSYNPASG